MLLAEKKELEGAVMLLESARRYCEKRAQLYSTDTEIDLEAFHAYAFAAHNICWRAHLVRRELRAFDTYGKRWHDAPNPLA